MSRKNDKSTLGKLRAILQISISYQNELNEYYAQQLLDSNDDPLQYWKQNSSRFPVLATMTKDYLAAMPTSMPCERLFSTAGLILNDLRSSLKPSNVRNLICCYSWAKKNTF